MDLNKGMGTGAIIEADLRRGSDPGDVGIESGERESEYRHEKPVELCVCFLVKGEYGTVEIDTSPGGISLLS